MKEWSAAKAVIGSTRVLAGPTLSHQLLHQPDHLAMTLSRYRAAAALIGDAEWVAEFGAGEGIGARILSKGRRQYTGFDADAEAVDIAIELHGDHDRLFLKVDVLRHLFVSIAYDAVVSLDTIEHIPSDQENVFMRNAVSTLNEHGVMVIGTPSANAYYLASPQSKVGHINNFTPERLKALMQRYFHRVILAGMQDTAIHFGHPGMFHYIIAVGIGPR